MSRIIVKNIPKIFTQKQIVEHFSKLDIITDCKIVKNQNGQSRRFTFVGFRDQKSAEKAKQKYNNTYVGSSKVTIDIAKIKGQQRIQKQNAESTNKIQNKKSQIKKNKVFQNYKKVVENQSKKSWDDLLVPSQKQYTQFEQQGLQPKKKQKRQQKIEQNTKQQQQKQIHHKMKQQKPIKAPRLSQKNKQYITKPLQIATNRLYITNIPYKLEQSQIKKQFNKFGNIIKIKLPRQYDGSTRGFFFLTFQKPQQALRAFNECDNKVIFGRIIHIKPSLQDIGQKITNAKQAIFKQKIKQKYGENLQDRSSFKKKKKKQMRQKLNDTTNWNTLFLNPNTVLQRMAKKLHITKSQILLSQNLAPKIALAQAQVIQQTKQWMTKNDINLNFLQKDRSLCERSKKTILIKNLNYRTQQSQLKQLLQFYGVLNNILLAPNRAIAIAQFKNDSFAQNAMNNLQNAKFKNNFLYLQYAPIGMINEETIQQKIKQIQKQQEQIQTLTKIVYIKNLNFETEEDSLKEVLLKIGNIKYVKIIKTKQGKSMGYGFVQYESSDKAIEAVKKLNNTLIDGHRISLSLSKKKTHDLQDIKKMKQKISQIQNKSNKLSVKNVAFQATKQQLRDLFKQFGSLKTVRMPKKMDGTHRGFAFVQYDTAEEAAVAKEALGSTHLYGRKLVIQYQKGEK